MCEEDVEFKLTYTVKVKAKDIHEASKKGSELENTINRDVMYVTPMTMELIGVQRKDDGFHGYYWD